MTANTPLNADDRLAPIEWLLDDLLVTIDDATPEELPNLHAKLTALVSGLQGREDEWHPRYRKKHELQAVRDYILSLGWQETDNKYVAEVLSDCDGIAKELGDEGMDKLPKPNKPPHMGGWWWL